MRRRNLLRTAGGALAGAGLIGTSMTASASTNLNHVGSQAYLGGSGSPDITMNFLQPSDTYDARAKDLGTMMYYLEEDLAGLNHDESPHPSVLDPDAGYPTIEVALYEYDQTTIGADHDEADSVLEGTQLEGTTDLCHWFVNDGEIHDGNTDGMRGHNSSEAINGSGYHPGMSNPSLSESDHPNTFLSHDDNRPVVANLFLTSFIRTGASQYWTSYSDAPGEEYTDTGAQNELAEGYHVGTYYEEPRSAPTYEWEGSFMIQWAGNPIDAIRSGDCQTPYDSEDPQDWDDFEGLRFHDPSHRPYVHPFSSCTVDAIQDTIDWMGF